MLPSTFLPSNDNDRLEGPGRPPRRPLGAFLWGWLLGMVGMTPAVLGVFYGLLWAAQATSVMWHWGTLMIAGVLVGMSAVIIGLFCSVIFEEE